MNERHDKVAGVIQSIAAKFVAHEANTNPLITVTRVEIAPNFRKATICFTTFPSGRESDALAFLQRHGREMRGHIKKDTRLKYIPHLDFKLDQGERHRQHIDTVVDSMQTTDTTNESL
jgi:ribosome-binding factor A